MYSPVSSYNGFCSAVEEMNTFLLSPFASQVQRTWWWRSPGQRQRIDDSDPGPALTPITPPCTWSTTTHNCTNTKLMSSGDEGRLEEQTMQPMLPRRPPPKTFSTSSSPHTITWKMHLSGSLWAEALAVRRSAKTLKLREWFVSLVCCIVAEAGLFDNILSESRC